MKESRNAFHALGDWWADHQKVQEQTSFSQWLPSRGSVLFTLLAIAVVLLAQQVWASGTQNGAITGPSASTVNYQGRLAAPDGTPKSGMFGMSFSVWDAADGGSIVWGPENHSEVSVVDGLFAVGLGSQTAGGIPPNIWSGDRYLEIRVGGETLTPRELIRGVPFAGLALTVPDASISRIKLGPDVSLAKIQSGYIEAGSNSQGWTLHTGTGWRTYTQRVTFAKSFSSTPTVIASLGSIDANTSASDGVRVVVSAQGITKDGFDMVIQTWGGSVLYSARMTWLAHGTN